MHALGCSSVASIVALLKDLVVEWNQQLPHNALYLMSPHLGVLVVMFSDGATVHCCAVLSLHRKRMDVHQQYLILVKDKEAKRSSSNQMSHAYTAAAQLPCVVVTA